MSKEFWHCSLHLTNKGCCWNQPLAWGQQNKDTLLKSLKSTLTWMHVFHTLLILYSIAIPCTGAAKRYFRDIQKYPQQLETTIRCLPDLNIFSKNKVTKLWVESRKEGWGWKWKLGMFSGDKVTFCGLCLQCEWHKDVKGQTLLEKKHNG